MASSIALENDSANAVWQYHTSGRNKRIHAFRRKNKNFCLTRAEKKLKISERYAILSINGEKKLAQASSSKQIKTEIEYINKTHKNYGWLDFTIIVLNLLGLYFSVSIYFFRPKVKMESEITTDEKNGHSYQQEKA